MTRTAFAVGVVFALLGGAPLARAKTVRVDPETPFFREPNVTGDVVAVAESLTSVASLESRRVYVECSAVAGRSWHPLMMASEFHRVDLDGQDAWFSEDFLFDPGRRLAVPRSLSNPEMGYVLAALLATLTGSVLAGWWSARRRSGVVFSAHHLLGVLILLRMVLLAGAIYLSGSVIVRPSDEHGYFQIARDLASGVFAANWRYTLGLPLFYLPLVVGTQAQTYFDILWPASVLGGFVLGPLALGLAFSVARRLGGSDRLALVVVGLLAVLPFVYFPVEFHSISGDGGVFKAIFGPLHCNPASYRLYYVYLWAGYNGMSDMLSTVLVLAVIRLLLDARAGAQRRWIATAAGLFGLACLVRVANVFLAPLFAYLAFSVVRTLRPPLREYALRGGGAAFTFLVVFFPQFLVNTLSFGSPFRFPYVLHDNRASVGFSLSDFVSGTSFLVGTNYGYVALGVAGLLSVRCSHLRRVLSLWGLPLVLFYAGYPVVGASPVRFTLPVYAAFLIAASKGVLDIDLTRRQLGWVSVWIGAACVLTCPIARSVPPFPLGLEASEWGTSLALGLSIALPLLSAVGLCWSVRRRGGWWRLAVFGVLYYAGSPHVLMVVAGALVCWAVASSVTEAAGTLELPTGVFRSPFRQR
ncbi:MAG: hypothetical protein HN742_00310 [Lentisphaerae bacterium]|nr:hypothetical protein [Lentisphaerota bacterium]MBT4815136.1 hypothetical protein [Lentisphaerota bacterium]MBT5608786.1 hypothetical protein [Lentisphaerota bacterium]MBT7058297.1 hypothetical protein [Lentisphaerota bacterium]MBT7840272.1 hypothetical protein [Lentisphaerota bacterium]